MEEEYGIISAEVEFTLKLPIQFIWKPKEDITTYELAMCLPILLGHITIYDKEELTKEQRRHFEILE